MQEKQEFNFLIFPAFPFSGLNSATLNLNHHKPFSPHSHG